MKTKIVIMITLFGLALLTGCEKANEPTPTAGGPSEQVNTETAPVATTPAPALVEPTPAPAEAAPAVEGDE